MSRAQPLLATELPHGGGTTGALVRTLDWTATPLGSRASWPPSLATLVETLLSSRHPMLLFWGPDLVQVYNDAFLPSLGAGKHPAAMGQRAQACWSDVWPLVGPQIADVIATAVPCWHEDALVPVARDGRVEEVYWTYSYSPVFQEDRTVGGTLVVCAETTSRVLHARREKLLRAVDRRTTALTAAADVLPAVLAVLGDLREDVPFAAQVGPRAGGYEVLAAVGLSAAGSATLRAALAASDEHGLPGLVLTGAIAAPPWPEPVTAGFEVPLGARGTLLFGTSPRRPFDDAYRGFLEQIGAAIAHAEERISASVARAALAAERRDLLLQAPVATALLTGPHHRYELANAPYIAMVGREVVGMRYTEAFPEVVGTALPGIHDAVYRDGVPFATSEMRVPLVRDGVTVDAYYNFNLQPIRDASGAVFGMMCIAIDVSEVVRAREELEAASRAKDEFLAMLGHELRNPLAPIVTALDIVEMRTPGERSREHQLVRRQVTHLVRLVDDLLDVSKITRGKIELRHEPVELADVVRKAIELADAGLQAHEHHLRVELPAEPVRWWADPVRLAQVLTNLLANAARYTPPGGDIRVTARVFGAEVEIAVADNGTGIAPELLPRIFDMFVQGHRSVDRAEGGLGLGLSLVKNLVALHGGTVRAASAGRGHGSEFTIRLPLTATEPARSATPLRGTTALPSKRVLVVDDNLDAAEMLAELLRASGHEVAVAFDGPSALELLPRLRPEVAILDIGLPGMDGYELAGRIAAAVGAGACRLVAVTGYGQASDRARTRAAGFDEHLDKPVSRQGLLAAMSAPTAPPT